MKNITSVAILLVTYFSQTIAQPKLNLEFVASGFTEPVGIACAGDERLFIVERIGTIRILHPDGTNTLFLDITDRVESSSGEQGLLGLAFHPDYASNGYFYVNYINLEDDTRISRFTVSSANPDDADEDSEFNILAIEQPALNHNGGDLHFGPDGYLHCAMGNGGGTANANAQDTTNLLGKILRIDVDGGSPYVAPADNPFAGVAGRDELWNFGLRNPWRFSFDRHTGDMYIADVGAAAREEINFQPSSSSGGENYGWRCYEGNLEVNPDICLDGYPFTFPVFDYPHDPLTGGFAVTGGFVYRGSEYPGMYGHYIFCDYISGNFWSMLKIDADSFAVTFHGNIRDDIPAFGENADGEIYACDKANGSIYKLVDECASLSLSFTVTNATAPTVNNGAIDLNMNGGTSPYIISWSNGATTEDISALTAGMYSVIVTDANGCIASDTISVLNDCSAATGVSVSSITANSAVISWNDVGATSYKVFYVSAASPPASVNTTSSSVTLTGLTPAVNYVFKIRNKCPGAPGNFITTGSFTTLPLKEFFPENETVFLYPNPNKGTFIISAYEKTERICVRDVSGKTMYEEEVVQQNISLPSLSEGVYLLTFFLKDGEHVQQKLIIRNE